MSVWVKEASWIPFKRSGDKGVSDTEPCSSLPDEDFSVSVTSGRGGKLP